ncbi:ATP-dependent DNA helicase At3g02060, chloroplastic [Linum perenne]
MKYTPVPKKTYIHHFTVSLPSLLLSYTAAVTLSCFSAIQLLTEISPLLSPLLRILQSAMASLDAFSSSSSLISSLHTFPYQLPTWSFFHLKCPSSLTHRYLSSSPFSSSLSSSLHVPSATSAAAAVPSPPRYRPGADTIHDGNDPISLLNLRIRTTRTTRDSSSSSRPSIDPQEAERYMQLVKEQQQRGLQKLKGDRQSTSGASFSYKVDPYTLVSGDYVVHRKAGIGRFVAIKYDVPNTSSRSEPIEYVFLEYADGMAKLPLRQASRLLYRYNLPNESKRPKTLNKLSDPGAWEKRKTKGKVAIQRMVVDLMELYLHRLKQRRPPYPKSPDMADFDAQFPYNPTPDQKQAFNDVERDLTERQTPMDRLICGDVGFGKTEVALRAIFFVVSAGKQTMILAPTIVLAKQHFDVISQRFSRYPNVKVGLLSRFQTRAEKVTYLRMIESGELNIVIGTHSLLGSRVVYNNLGLLVVDEEQRFGVKQKEKIASFKTSVDVLTLSATPIPRTLYLALTGFRDASLISTPPPERVPIKTHLSPYNEEKIALAIKNELDRGGQVFYVLPRIKGLSISALYTAWVFVFSNGAIVPLQLYSKQLEQTMEKFAFGEIKILICTNIVESGIDIPNANTIIIQDVQFFGLSQLHQLRGRVGRADKEAHAYLFYPDRSLLTEQALERLQAMEECVDLGQGFQIAERDMGIRGFGTIFGEQQTGDVGNVGIDLFFEMLFESLSKVDLNVIPRHSSEYINFLDNPIEIIEEAEKAAEKDLWSLVQFTENLRRQYGKEPYSMEILLKKLYVRRMAADMGITRIYASGKMVGMQTNMSKGVFELMSESMSSNARKNSLVLEGDVIKAELLLELHSEQLLNWVFQCLSELHACLPWVMKY